MPRTKHDPSEPDFPHGSVTGYFYGCRKSYPCPAPVQCYAVASATNLARRRRYYETLPEEQRPKPRYRPGALAKRLRGYREEGWTLGSLSGATGVAENTLKKVLNRQQRALTQRVAKAIAELTVEQLIECSVRYIPAQLVRWKIRALYAMGYSHHRLARGLKKHRATVDRLLYSDDHPQYVFQETYKAICTLYEEWGAAPAPTGLTADLVRADAAARGWYPPDCYSDDGRLWTEETETRRNEHLEARYAEREKLALRRLHAVDLTLRYGYSSQLVAEQLGLGPAGRDQIIRFRKESGLKWVKSEVFTTDDRDRLVLEPGQEKRVAEVKAVLERWHLYPGDPYEYCLELGMMKDKWFTIGQPSRHNLLVRAA